MGEYDDLTPQGTVNRYAVGVVSVVCFCTLVGWVVDNFVLRKQLKGSPKDRPRGWVLGMLMSSYTLLIPGLLHTLFGYRIGVMNGMKVLSERNDNTIQFAQELISTGSALGAVAVITFAVVLPIAKLILLSMGGTLRHSRSRSKRLLARRCVIFVQQISKWASPDMFAYLLLMYLIRGLNHPPILNGDFNFDVGFTCFATFCIASTISSLGVRAPTRHELGLEDVESPCKLSPPILLAIVSVLTVVFGITMYMGCTATCMALRLDMDLIFQSGQVDIDLKPLIEMLHVQELAADDVSIMDCISNLWKWIVPSEDDPHWGANSALGFVLLSGLVVGFTILDVVVCLGMAVYMQVTEDPPELVVEIARVLRKLSMLDVCIVGVIVIILAGRIYRASGVIISFGVGLYYMSAAEVCHYAIHYLVMEVAADEARAHRRGELSGKEFKQYPTSESIDSEETTMRDDSSEEDG